jgi:hypothetical protein
MRTLMVGAILLMSLLFVGTIQADEGGVAASRATTAGLNVTVNGTFDAAIGIDEGAAALDINCVDGPAGGIFVINDPVAQGWTFDYSLDNTTSVVSFSDDNVTITIASGVISFVPTDVLITDGTTDVILYAVNTTGAWNASDFASVDLTVTVTAINDYPAIDDVATIEATQGTEIAVALNGSDEETTFENFDFEVTFAEDWAEAPETFPDSIWLLEDGEDSWWLKVNATNDDAIVGEYYLNISLIDEGDLFEALVNVTCEIENLNDAPVLTDLAAAVDVTENVTAVIPVVATDIDLMVPGATDAFVYTAKVFLGDDVVNGTALTVTAMYDDVNDTYYGDIEYTADADAVYDDTVDGVSIWLEVTDGALTDDTTFELNVGNVNDPPVLTALETNVYAVDQDAMMTIGFYATDMDAGDDQIWAYNIDVYPGLRADLYDYGEAIVINETAAAAASTWNTTEGDPFFGMAGYETVSWYEFMFTPANADVGYMLVNLSVADAEGAVWEILNITINNVNDAPTAPTLNKPTGETGGDTNLTAIPIENASFVVNLSGSGGDDIDLLVSDEALSYTVDWDDGGTAEAVTADETGAFVLQHTYTAGGEYYVNFTVKDKAGLKAWDGYWIIVSTGEIPLPPEHVDIVIDYVLVMKDLSDLTVEELADEIINDPTGYMDLSPGEKGNAMGSYDDDGRGDEDYKVWIVFYDKDGNEISREGGVQTDGSFDIPFTVPKGTHSYDVISQEGDGTETPTPDSMKTAWGTLDPSSGDDDDGDGDSMMLILILLIVIILVVVILLVVIMKKKAKKRAEEEERRRKEEEAAAAIAPAMERAGYLQSLAAGAQLDLSTMQPQFDDATAKQAEGNNIEANEVITAYNTSIEQALVAQGMDVEAQVAALAAQQQAGELPPDQAAAMGAEGALPPDQAAAYGAEGALPPAEGAVPPDQAFADPAAAAAVDPAAAPPDPAAQSAPCPFCQQPIAVGTPQCAACGNAIQWG